jgi:hypothetical protein
MLLQVCEGGAPLPATAFSSTCNYLLLVFPRVSVSLSACLSRTCVPQRFSALPSRAVLPRSSGSRRVALSGDYCPSAVHSACLRAVCHQRFWRALRRVLVPSRFAARAARRVRSAVRSACLSERVASAGSACLKGVISSEARRGAGACEALNRPEARASERVVFASQSIIGAFSGVWRAFSGGIVPQQIPARRDIVPQSCLCSLCAT